MRLVKTVADLPAYRYLFENMRYEADYDFARKRALQVGEMGVVLCYLPAPPSCGWWPSTPGLKTS